MTITRAFWIASLCSTAAVVIAAQPRPPEQIPADRLRTIGHAVRTYANENRGHLPPSLGYTLAAHAKPGDLVRALTAAPTPAGFGGWETDRQSRWTDDHTDVLYLQGWQHYDARLRGDDGRLRPGTPRRVKAGAHPLAALSNEDQTLDVVMTDGRVIRYSPLAGDAPATKPAPGGIGR